MRIPVIFCMENADGDYCVRSENRTEAIVTFRMERVHGNKYRTSRMRSNMGDRRIMKRRAQLAGLILAAAAAVSLTACGSAQGKTLRVGVKDNVANFGLYDEESGRYSGMEIDLAQILSDDLGYANVEYTTVSATSREELIDSGELDLVIATYSITEGRQEKYDFSVPYYTDYGAIMVEQSSMIEKLPDLKDCTIGVIRNSSNTLMLAKFLAEKGIIPEFDEADFSAGEFDDGLRFVEFDTYDEVADALEYGDVDAFAADRSILSGYMDDERSILETVFSEQSYGVCTKKDSQLSAKVNEAVQKRLDDGTIADLIDKWGN